MADGRFSVTFISPGRTGEVFWDMTAASMQAAADQLGIELEVLRAERNRYRMQQLGHEVVERPSPPDYLILVNEEQAAGEILADAGRHAVKTLLILNDIVGAEAETYGEPRTRLASWLGSLVPDSRAAGRRMADRLIADMRQRGPHDASGRLHMLAIGGDPITPTSIARNAGLSEAVAGASDVVLDRLLMANWNRADALTATNRYLDWAERVGVAPAGVWAANDAMALGAMEAFAARGLEPGRTFGIVGLNWSGEAVRAVQDGRMILTDGGHFLAGAWAMVLLRDYHDGCDTGAGAPRQTFPMAAIDRSNAQTLAAMLVAGDFSRIDFSRFTGCRTAESAKTPPESATAPPESRKLDVSMPRILEALRPAALR